MDWSLILAILGGLTGIGSLITVLATLRPTQRKITAETKHLEASAESEHSDAVGRTLEGAFALIDKLSDQLAKTEKRLSDLECENDKNELMLERAVKRIHALMEGITHLVAQIKANGLKPIWVPDDWDLEEEKKT